MAKKKVIQEQDDMRRFFPDIGVDEPDDDKKASSEDPTTALLQKIGALEEKFTQAQRDNETLRQQQSAMLSQPIISTRVEGPQLLELPDPVADPKAYAEALRKNIRAELDFERQQERAQFQEQNTMQQRTNGLWNDFSTKHSDYAKDPERVKIAATQVAEAARARGVDVNKYMFLTPDQFMNDVKAKMDSFGWGKQAEGGDDDDDDDEIRTAGISGGLESGGRPSSVSKQDQQAGSIYDGIKEWQAKTGFHR